MIGIGLALAPFLQTEQHDLMCRWTAEITRCLKFVFMLGKMLPVAMHVAAASLVQLP